MSHDKRKWEDIQSLEGLEIDWDFKVENPLGNRSHTRLNVEEISKLYNIANIPVKLVTEKEQCTAALVDLSQGGICLDADLATVEASQLVKLGFILGGHKIISRGRIKHVSPQGKRMILGIEFVGVMGENQDYIAQLYSSLKLKGG